MQQFESLHSEKAAVASILQNPDFITELDGIDLTAFRNPANRAIVQLAIHLKEEKGFEAFDRELLQNRIVLFPVEGIDTVQMQNYISALFSADIEPSNFNTYLHELQSSHLRNSLSKMLHKGIEEIQHNDPSHLLGDLQTRLYELDAGINRNNDPTDVSKDIERTIQKLTTTPKTGIPTGIDLLDDIMLGWMKKKFYFVGARPGEGKSAFLLQAAAHAAYFAKDKRVPVLYIDTEIEDEEFEIRLIGHLAGVDTKIIQQGLFVNDPETYKNVMKAMAFVKELGGIYHLELPAYTVPQVVNIIKKYVYKYGVGLVIFDQIEEPAYDGRDRQSRWERVGLLARTLKQLAQILNIPVLAALQQNKKGADKSRVSSEAYAESDDVFKKADGALALNRKTATEIENETIQAGTHRLQILKGRYHAISFNGINLRYVGYCLRFWPARLQATEQEQNEHDSANDEQRSDIPTISDNYTQPLIP